MRPVHALPQFRAGYLEMLPIALAMIPFGLVCGVAAAAAGADFAGALGMSALMFSGAAQIVAAQLLAQGAPAVVVVLTCAVLGLRFVMYSAAMAPLLRPLPSSWQRVLAFLVTDQFAASVAHFGGDGDARRGALHFAGGGVALWSSWQVMTMAGYLAGNAIPAAWSLEFTVPLCFLALLAPTLRDAPAIVAAVVAGVAVLAFDALPMRLNLVAAGLAGIAAGTAAELARERWRAR